MHDYELGWDMLIHPKNPETDKLCNILCTAPFEEDCSVCNLGHEPKYVRVMLMFIFNTLGQTYTYTDTNGAKKTIPLCPVQAVQIQADGKGGQLVLPMFKNFNKLKEFDKSIWVIRRENGPGKGFTVPTTITEEELLTRLGNQNISPNLPEYAQNWANTIKEIMEKHGKEKAKDEVFRFLATCFDNKEDIAKIKRIELPKKEQVEKKDTTNSSSADLIVQ